MPIRRDNHAKAIEDQGFKLLYNPPGGGNCQFAALLHQAKRMGTLRSPETMRKEIVEYLKSNPFDSNGFPLLEHLAWLNISLVFILHFNGPRLRLGP